MNAAEQLRALKHPGQTATINGHHVKREAFRFVIDGSRYAYSTDDAITLLREAASA